MDGSQLSIADARELRVTARRVRRHVIAMATNGGCFLGASLSCVDLVVYLYSRFLYIRPDRLDDPARDYFLLSKGHDVPALYGTFAELGFMPPERLANHLRPHDLVYWHPNRAIPGVEFHSGSLGHLLSVASGIAYDVRLRGSGSRVVVVVGDGELDEGSNWEALLVASALGLDHLTVIVDRNAFQANMRTEELIPLEPLDDKLAAFRCRVAHADGHDFQSIAAAMAYADEGRGSGMPTVVIARTTRGKGLPSIEARADRWFCNFGEAEIEALLAELEGEAPAVLATPGLVVR